MSAQPAVTRAALAAVLPSLALGFALVLACGLGAGCASVPAYQREHLADPIMSFDAQAKRDARMMKALEAREGSTGGTGGAGGGCACN
jgi:uncharacterized protein DUF4266